MKQNELIIGIIAVLILIALAVIFKVIPLWLGGAGELRGNIAQTTPTTYDVYVRPEYIPAAQGVEGWVALFSPTITIDGIDKTSETSITMMGEKHTYSWYHGFAGAPNETTIPPMQLAIKLTTQSAPATSLVVSIPYVQRICNPAWSSCGDLKNAMESIGVGDSGLTITYTATQPEQGCKYNNPACASGQYCDTATNTCKQTTPSGDVLAQIIKAITDFLASIGNFVSNLFGGG